MDIALEQETGKMVHAWTINKDTSYIQPEKDKFLANPSEIENYKEVLTKHNLKNIEVRYKRGHDRFYKSKNDYVFVTPHFFILNKNKLGVNTYPESKEHKAIKTFIYSYFFNNPELELYYSEYKRKNETEYQSIKLKDIDIDWDSFSLEKKDIFEVRIMDTFNTRRVDVFLRFKEFDKLLGNGIVIEVQLGSQSKEIIKKRTIDRALKGYSCIWLYNKHFIDIKEDNLELKENSIVINTWQSTLQASSETICDDIYSKIKKYSREFDDKIENTLFKINNIYKEYSDKMDKMYKDKFYDKAFPEEGMICPACGLGTLIKKKGYKNKFFLGCSKYPNCNQTYNIEQNEIKDE